MYVLLIFKFSCLLLNFQLHRGDDMAHGDDAGNLKWAVVQWIDEMYGPSDPPSRLVQRLKEGSKTISLGVYSVPVSGAGMIRTEYNYHVRLSAADIVCFQHFQLYSFRTS